jgi:type I restriction enzyme, S subunit
VRTGWPEVALGEVCEFRYGKALRETDRAGDRFGVYGSNGEVGRNDRAITVGRKGSLGKITYSNDPCWPIDTAYFIDETSTRADLRWLYYCLGSLGLSDMNRAAAVPGLNREDAYRVRVLLPPIEEQRRIAAILDKADELRAKRRAALAHLDSLTQSIFLDMFGDPSINPKGWQTAMLSDLVDRNDRINYGVVQPGDVIEGGVPFVRVGDLRRGVVDRTRLKTIDPSIEAAYRRSRLVGSEVLVSCVGTIGEIAIASEHDRGSNIARAVARVPLLPEFGRKFIAAHLRTSAVQRYFTSELRTVSQPTLNIKQLSETPMVVPPKPNRDRFEDVAGQLCQEIATSELAQADLEGLFASLQQRAFAGEL